MIKFKEDTHQYFNEKGKELISVTTLMKKHGLAPDYSKVKKTVLNAKAERGSLIHKEIEDYIKEGEIGFTKEFMNFKQYMEETGEKVLECECLVYNDIVAGKIDLIIDDPMEPYIKDNKTTSKTNKESVIWQISIYTYLAYLNGLIPKYAKKCGVNHFKDNGEMEVLIYPTKPIEEVEYLMECERRGEIYQPKTKMTKVEAKMVEELNEIERVIAYHEAIKKESEKQAKALREKILLAMEKGNVKSLETDHIKILYVDPYNKKVLDGERLKKERPDIVKEYTKETAIKGSLRITLKEEK